jgi:hypothetical protein
MSLFDFDEKRKEITTAYKPEKPLNSRKYKTKSRSINLLRKENAKEILNQIGGLPEKNESVDLITNGQSNAGGFYEVIREEWGTIDEICISTWIINRSYIDMLLDDVKKGVIKNLTMIISNRMAQLTHHTPNFNYMKTEFSKHPNINFRVVNSHAKTYCLKNGSKFITIDGSGNWSKNPRVENYTITNSKEKFIFRKMWMNEFCNQK